MLTIITKNVQSVLADDRFGELCVGLESVRWDILLLNETWRADREENFITAAGHRFIGAGGRKVVGNSHSQSMDSMSEED